MDKYKNKLIKFIDINESNDEILLTFEDGEKLRFYHRQECCESVFINSVKGESKKLNGVILKDIDISFDRKDTNYGIEGETTIIFITDEETVITKWIGSSNGYYSIHVDIKEL